jgi:hypothetical protein
MLSQSVFREPLGWIPTRRYLTSVADGSLPAISQLYPGGLGEGSGSVSVTRSQEDQRPTALWTTRGSARFAHWAARRYRPEPRTSRPRRPRVGGENDCALSMYRDQLAPTELVSVEPMIFHLGQPIVANHGLHRGKLGWGAEKSRMLAERRSRRAAPARSSGPIDTSGPGGKFSSILNRIKWPRRLARSESSRRRLDRPRTEWLPECHRLQRDNPA